MNYVNLAKKIRKAVAFLCPHLWVDESFDYDHNTDKMTSTWKCHYCKLQITRNGWGYPTYENISTLFKNRNPNPNVDASVGET